MLLVTPRHRQDGPGVEPRESIVTETNLSPENLDENRTQVDVGVAEPQVSGLIRPIGD
jgi:hypothetical protein